MCVIDEKSWMMGGIALVSVVCPVYNKERYLDATITSVKEQTSRFWELILVDDGSTDQSVDICQRAAMNDERIRFFRRDHIEPNRKGANICRNIGINKSRGRYMIFLDADDVLLPFCIEQRLRAAECKPGFSMYVFNVAYTSGANQEPFAKRSLSKKEYERISRVDDLRDYFLKRFLSFDLPWHTSGPMWDIKVLLSMKGFDGNFQRLQDPEIHTRLLLNKNIRIDYRMGDTPYDVLHITDESRVVWSPLQFYEKQIDAIAAYIKKFVPLVKDRFGMGYLKHLEGYLILIEKLTYRYFRDNPVEPKIKDVYVKRKNELFKQQEVQEIMTARFKLFVVIYRLLNRSSFLSKLKIPGVVLLLMRRSV